MSKNLVIVESPAKAKTIEKFLGKDYTVLSSFGHVRDLSKKDISIDIENGFIPKYEILPDKQKIVAELQKMSKSSDTVWLATDEDREGEAISWHLAEALKLPLSKIKRIVFHEITKDAILKAIENPRAIDQNLVNAQQARRVLDRIVGYELSPLLWKKVRPSLSAGRVQSVAVRLIVEKEEEIKQFESGSQFRIIGNFLIDAKSTILLSAELNKRFDEEKEALGFINHCIKSSFIVDSVEKKPGTRTPAPPFTTSTLQQEAARKLGFSVSQTMTIAQQLYEAGHITYMRTDSVHLSELALSASKKEITSLFGPEFVKTRQYVTKSKGAQEAHEAIRPTYLSKSSIDGSAAQKKLYDLIWKRTIACQMSDAKIERTIINILVSDKKEYFQAKGEVITFEGFLKVYEESRDDEPSDENPNILPAVKKGQPLTYKEIIGEQKFAQQPARYSEASLVKKMEELGIGRPSTYAPTISTIQKREYVIKENRLPKEREVKIIQLNNSKVSTMSRVEKFGGDKGKLFPTDLGTIVTRFLYEHFSNIVDYQFTANAEIEFDEIANGKKKWNEMISKFYKGFKPQISETNEKSSRYQGERLLGKDPASGKNVYAKLGPYGPMIQIGEATDEVKPQFASLLKGQSIESVTFDEAMAMFKFPKALGVLDGEDVVVSIGRFGPYVRIGGTFVSIPRQENPCSISLQRAVELMEEKKNADRNKEIRVFDNDPELKILKGRFGPYLKYKNANYPLGKGNKAETITYEECLNIINSSVPREKKTSPLKSKEKKLAAPSVKTSTAKKKTAASKKKTAPAKKKTVSSKKSKK